VEVQCIPEFIHKKYLFIQISTFVLLVNKSETNIMLFTLLYSWPKRSLFFKSYITSCLHYGRVSGYGSFEGTRQETRRRNPEYLNPQQQGCEKPLSSHSTYFHIFYLKKT
jgi:hypothetical protein